MNPRELARVIKSSNMEVEVIYSNLGKCVSSHMDGYIYNVVEYKYIVEHSGPCGYSLDYSLVFLNGD